MRKWTKSIIIKEIKELHNEGESLQAGSVIENNHKLYSAAWRYFGNWYEAVKEAGINPHGIIKETKETNIESKGVETQIERMLKTIYYISNYPGTTSRMLAELIGVSSRTIQRYISSIRKIPGIEVKYIDKHNGYDIQLEGSKKEEDPWKYMQIWSKKDMRLLKYLIKKGESDAKIAELLERSIDSIRNRKEKLKINKKGSIG